MNGIRHSSYGYITYRDTSCILLIQQEIVDYYYSLIPKYFDTNRQKYPAHITIIRKFEKPTIRLVTSNIIRFEYDGKIHYKHPYFFMNCWSDDIGDLREDCGLPRYRFADTANYHFTIGNIK